jgi:RHS repeat-associated protein
MNNLECSIRLLDGKDSVLGTHTASKRSYCPYGYSPTALLGSLAFSGERLDASVGAYLLGNGYRGFSPILRRFNSPDQVSPFGRGGINAYAYCSGDPINMTDSTGQAGEMLRKPLKRLQHHAMPLSGKSKKKPRYRRPVKPSRRPVAQTPVLHNRKQDKFEREYEEFQAAIVEDPFQPLILNDLQQLKSISGVNSRRFVYTDRGQILVDPSIDLQRRGINHAILATFAGPEANVLAAGMIASPGLGQVRLWNDSGHYHPGFSTLQPVARLLELMGAKVESIRLLESEL